MFEKKLLENRAENFKKGENSSQSVTKNTLAVSFRDFS